MSLSVTYVSPNVKMQIFVCPFLIKTLTIQIGWYIFYFFAGDSLHHFKSKSDQMLCKRCKFVPNARKGKKRAFQKGYAGQQKALLRTNLNPRRFVFWSQIKVNRKLDFRMEKHTVVKGESRTWVEPSRSGPRTTRQQGWLFSPRVEGWRPSLPTRLGPRLGQFLNISESSLSYMVHTARKKWDCGDLWADPLEKRSRYSPLVFSLTLKRPRFWNT